MCSLIIRKTPIVKSVRRQKITRARFRIKPQKRVDRIALSAKFGDSVTADHKIRNVEKESRCGHKDALIVQDDLMSWIQSYPMKTKDTSETMSCLQGFLPPPQKLEILYTDSSKEFIEACQDIQWNHDTSTLYRSEAGRRVKERTAVAQVQSGLPGWWWDCAMEDYWSLRNVHDKMAEGKTAVERRFGQTFDGLFFGTLVECILMTAQDKARVHQFDKETLNGMFLGHVLRAERGWSGALMIADFGNVQESEASEIYAGRFQSPEVPVKTEHEFPCANGTLRLPNLPRPSSIAEGKHRTRRWCWSRRRRQKGKKNRRFVVYEWRIHVPTSWRTSFEVLRPIRRHNETNSDERKQCLWKYCQWFVDRNEGCHSIWKVDWGYKMPDPPNKTFWRTPLSRK